MRFFIGLLAMASFGASVVSGCTAIRSADPAAHDVGAISDATSTIERKVLVLDVDPILATQGGVRLTTYKGWDKPTVGERAQQLADWFHTASRGRVTFRVVDTQMYDTFPKKADGFTYDEATYLAVLDNRAAHHEPDLADYMPLLDKYDVCGKVNGGAIDEVWMFGAPWLGFYESRLAGPNAFFYNSPQLEGTTCNRLVPMMGFAYHVGLENMVHDFGHRTESTMARVYGSWNQDKVDHAWDKFGLVASQSPTLGMSGCGSIHRPPASPAAEYIYDSKDARPSFCDDFLNYPNLRAPADAAVPTTCSAWGCTEIGYYAYWFGHLPHFAGVGPDGKANDWWPYLVDPNTVTSSGPPAGCRTFDGDESTCTVQPGCAYYQCSKQCWPKGTPDSDACPGCHAFDGDEKSCSTLDAACAYYQCSQKCFPRGTPNDVACGSPPSCRTHDGDVSACGAQSGCAYYQCSNQCWPTGTPNDTACPPPCRAHDGDVNACNGQSGCAYYMCSNQCWPTGTSNATACPSICRTHDGSVDACNGESGCAYYLCSNTCWSTGTANSVACP